MLILASASPRRRDLLARLGVPFRVESASAAVDERRLPGETPPAMTERLAVRKARNVLQQQHRPPRELVVLGGDTVVAIGDEILGKPHNRAQAAAMLQKLSGNTHTVFSAVAAVAAQPTRQLHRISVTEVTFCDLSPPQIERYCAQALPFDKAGGYAIQGAAEAFVTRLHGSYSGVLGLPLWETWQLLQELDCAGGFL